MDDYAARVKTGRPTDYTEELGEEICIAIATSSKGIKSLCKIYSHWPSPKTVFEWRLKNKQFSDRYIKAKHHQVEVIVDELLEIADDTSRDTIVKTDDAGNEKLVCNTEWINRSRIRIDTRKWLAAKLCPRLYGDKVHLNVDEENASQATRLLDKMKEARAVYGQEY
jgi:hypothetical protein